MENRGSGIGRWSAADPACSGPDKDAGSADTRKEDQTIPAMESGAAAAQLKAAGYDVTLDIQAGVGHTISIQGAQEALVFLKKRFLV